MEGRLRIMLAIPAYWPTRVSPATALTTREAFTDRSSTRSTLS